MTKYIPITGNIHRDYEIYAGREGLYGVAFFGHRFKDCGRTRNARRKLQYIWRRLLNIHHGVKIRG